MERKYYSLVLAVFAIVFLFSVVRAYADTNTRYVPATQCKQLNAECEVNNSEKNCCSGLVCLPFNTSSENGKCGIVPSATPTVTIVSSPTTTPVLCPVKIVNDCGTYNLVQDD